MQKSFKEQKDGSFELLLDDQDSGIFFHIPPKCKMEDYNIVIIGQQLVSSSRAHFTLNNRPENMGQIKINSEADIHFENNINIKVNKSLEIGRNNNLVINSYSKAELYFDELLITKNTNTEINLVAEGPRKAAVDYRQIPIAMSSIRNNNFCIFSLGTNIKKFDLANNSSTSQDIPFRISVARADYAIVEGNQVTPTSEDAIIMADVTGGFNLRHAQMTINGKNQIRNDYIPPMDGMFPFTTIRDCAPTFDNSVVETSAISLTVAASSNVVPISFKDEVKLNTERDAKISGQNSLENIVITCQYESIHLDSNGEIKDSQIEFYTKQDASTYGRTIKGSKFANAKMTNVIHDLLLDSMKKPVQKISDNKNISLSVRRDIRGIDFKNNSGSDNRKRVDIIADSILASINNVTIKVSGATPTINLSADAVALEGTNFEVGGVLDITNNGVDTLGGSKLAIANGTISQVMGDVAHAKSSHLTVDCDYLNIHSNVRLKISGNNEIICKGGRVDFEGGNHSLMESKVIAPKDTELTINTLSMQDDALLEVTETKNGKCNIKSVVFSGGQMRDAKGGMIDAVLSNNAKVDNITFGDSSYFWFGTSYFSADKGKYEAKNITLKENASLLVKNNKPDDAYMKIEDVIVSGNCQIDGSLAANIKNSVLNKADIFFTEKQGNIDIVNTIFEGKNSIEGISSIVDSSIENSTIVGNGDKIEAFMLRNIKNFAKALEEKKLAENKDQNNKITTKWEPL